MQGKVLPREPNLPGNVWAFIYAYVNCRDKAEAARRARFKPEAGKRLFKSKLVYREIRRLIELQDQESAKLIAGANKLSVEFLDSAMVETINDLEPGLPRVKALELAYTRTGVLDKGSLIALPPATPTRSEPPQIYTAMQFRTRRTTEEVTEIKQVTVSSTLPTALPPAEDYEILDLP